MRFDTPSVLALLPVVALALLALFWWMRWKRGIFLRRLGDVSTVQKLVRGLSLGRRRLKMFLLSLGVLLLVFSLARPQYGAVERAVDCSMSMLARDMEPNRLGRALEQLRRLVLMLRGNNVGVLAFAGVPVVQCPLTSDYSMVLNLLEAVDVDTVPVQGTRIAAVIDKAIETFQAPGKGRKVLVLLTDGEDHEGAVREAAQRAAEAGVVIYAIGIGDTEGQPIPLPEGGYKESGGSKVSTRLDFETLREAALTTGGKAIRANEKGDLEIEMINKDIRALETANLQAKVVTSHIERYQYFLAPALLLLIIEMLISERPMRARRERQYEA
ncbi:MAG: VWA domain-containing protein [Candidatus Sumerlaeota bacterium]